MSKSEKKQLSAIIKSHAGEYGAVLDGLVELLEAARRASARAVNSVVTSTYWEIGRRIVEFEQGGKDRAEYGTKLLERLSSDLTSKFDRGFSKRNLEQMRLFYQGWPIAQTLSAQSDDAGRPNAARNEQILAPIAMQVSAAVGTS
jgi:hypothetical protein